MWINCEQVGARTVDMLIVAKYKKSDGYSCTANGRNEIPA